MEYIVELEKIKKKYGKSCVLDDISVSMEKGKIYGLLGINGAGKTTLLRIVTGLIPGYSGKIRLFGGTDLNAGRKKVGATIENPVLFENLSAMENLEMYGSVCNMKKQELEKILDIVGLENNKKIAKRFSLGMKQKLALAITLIGNPELIILDEPTNGLDPIAIKELRNLIVRLNKEKGISFLISSHDVNELVKVADSLLFLQAGDIRYNLYKQDAVKTAAERNMEIEDYIISLMEKSNG